MREVIFDQPERVGSWVMEQMGANWFPGRGQAFGILEDGELFAGVAFTDWNRQSLCMHVACLPGKLWASPSFLQACFRYPFEHLSCQKVIAPIGSSNTKSRQFVEHIGFVLEATLKDAYPDGDLLFYTMAKADCLWLT